MTDQERIANLEQTVAHLANRLDLRDRHQLTYPLDTVSLDAMSRGMDSFLLNKIFDLIWRKTYKYSTAFESLDGFFTTSGVTLDNAVNANSVQILTNGGNGDLQELQKVISVGSLISVGLKSSIHCHVFVSHFTRQTAYILAGEKTISPFYGFKIVDGKIYGVVSNAGTAAEATTLLYDTPPPNHSVFLEARYFPRQGVQYIVRFLNAAGTAVTQVIGSITDITKLPQVTALQNSLVATPYLFDITLQANAASTQVTVSTGYDQNATSIVLTAGGGATLPTAPFDVAWWNSTDYATPTLDPHYEVVRVNAIVVDTLTVVRAQEGTAASTKNTAGKTYKMQVLTPQLNLSYLEYFQQRNVLQ